MRGCGATVRACQASRVSTLQVQTRSLDKFGGQMMQPALGVGGSGHHTMGAANVTGKKSYMSPYSQRKTKV